MIDIHDPAGGGGADQVDEDLDTTSGDRDPLTTDDGLTAAAATLPVLTGEVPPAGEDNDPHRSLQSAPGLDITEDGGDPLADLAQPGTEVN